MNQASPKLPLVYACSGASSAAQAAQMLQRIQQDLTPASPPKNAASSQSAGLPKPAGEKPREPSSPMCYLNEFKDW